MEVRFTHLGSFIEEEGRVIAQGRRDGRMFILDSTDGGTAVVKKTVQGWNWGAKAWEPALHARARQVVYRGELGT